MASTSSKTFRRSLELKQKEVQYLVHELRQLLRRTQTQFAAELGAAYETTDYWENGPMRPSAVALRQLGFLVERFAYSSSKSLQEESKVLLNRYFLKAQRKEWDFAITGDRVGLKDGQVRSQTR